MSDTTRKTAGIHHAGLTVPDLNEARAFFTEALGFHQVGEVPDYPAVFLSDDAVLLTLWQAEPGATEANRRSALGLHHLALKVADGQSLDALHRELAARDDVTLEFAPESLHGGPTHHMMFYIPGNIRLELIAPAS